MCNLALSSAGKLLKKLKNLGLIEKAVEGSRGSYKFVVYSDLDN